MKSGAIFDVKKYSINDGPGIRTTVFFSGCPLSCWWCHNPESQDAAPQVMVAQDRCIRCGECRKAC
ncbi:MAG: 4Fe-4S cluster-binding domain-containing protein, partial [Chloroflexi bacterium]|nr:4Fe-4S cluster-binding domain-containing protein [Chloroflexota bacterium]